MEDVDPHYLETVLILLTGDPELKVARFKCAKFEIEFHAPAPVEPISTDVVGFEATKVVVKPKSDDAPASLHQRAFNGLPLPDLNPGVPGSEDKGV